MGVHGTLYILYLNLLSLKSSPNKKLEKASENPVPTDKQFSPQITQIMTNIQDTNFTETD